MEHEFEFLTTPLADHEHGLVAGIEAAAAEITDRVKSWSTPEVAE